MLPLAVAATLALSACQGAGSSDPPSAAGSSSSAAAAAGADLLGAGSTFVDPVMQEWIGAYAADHDQTTISYEGIGSGGGIEQLTAQSIDFAASDAFMTDEEVQAASDARGCDVVHIPMVFGAVTVAYNLPGVDGLVLDANAIAGIFLGTITTWNDGAIAELNPDATLPDAEIVVAHRSDSSGTTNIFSTYLDGENPDWHGQVGAGKELQWPTGVGAQGNDGVAAAIAQNEGGVGYVELSYALENGLQVASVVNADGTAIQPSLDSTAAAAESITIPDDLRFNISDVGGDGYPIAGATWVVGYTCGYDEAKAIALKGFLHYALEAGSQAAQDLNYATLTPDLKQKALANVDRINADS